jgi:hemoglobin
MTEQSLYERLGGVNAIAMVVDRFSDEIVTNPKLNVNPALKAWNTTGQLPGLKFMRTLWLCQAAGGPFRYTGKDLRAAHAGLHITSDEFDEVGAEIARALDHFKVPERDGRWSWPPSSPGRPSARSTPGSSWNGAPESIALGLTVADSDLGWRCLVACWLATCSRCVASATDHRQRVLEALHVQADRFGQGASTTTTVQVARLRSSLTGLMANLLADVSIGRLVLSSTAIRRH